MRISAISGSYKFTILQIVRQLKSTVNHTVIVLLGSIVKHQNNVPTMAVEPSEADPIGGTTGPPNQTNTIDTNQGNTETKTATKSKIRVDFPTQPGSFNANEAIGNLLRHIYDMDTAFMIHSIDNKTAINSTTEIPTDEPNIRKYFEFQTDRNGRITMAFTATTSHELGWYKKGHFFQYLNDNRIWIGTHQFETLKLSECGWLLDLHPQWTNRTQLISAIRNRLADTLSEVTDMDIGNGQDIPHFELRASKILHRHRGPETQNEWRAYRTTAITVWCDTQNLELFRQMMIDHVCQGNHMFGTFVTTGKQNNMSSQLRAQLIARHNNLTAELRQIKVKHCHPIVMNSATVDSTDTVIDQLRGYTPSGWDHALFWGIEQHPDARQPGTFTFIVKPTDYEKAVDTIDAKLTAHYQNATTYEQFASQFDGLPPTRTGPKKTIEYQHHLEDQASQLPNFHPGTALNRRNQRQPPHIVFTKPAQPKTAKPTPTPPKNTTRNPWQNQTPWQNLQNRSIAARDDQSSQSQQTIRTTNHSQVNSQSTMSESDAIRSELSTIVSDFSKRMQKNEEKMQQITQEMFDRQMKQAAEQQEFQRQQAQITQDMQTRLLTIMENMAPFFNQLQNQRPHTYQTTNQDNNHTNSTQATDTRNQELVPYTRQNETDTPRYHSPTPTTTTTWSTTAGHFSPTQEVHTPMEAEPLQTPDHESHMSVETQPRTHTKRTFSERATPTRPPQNGKHTLKPPPIPHNTNTNMDITKMSPLSWNDMNEEEDSDKDDAKPAANKITTLTTTPQLPLMNTPQRRNQEEEEWKEVGGMRKRASKPPTKQLPTSFFATQRTRTPPSKPGAPMK
jgi:hypothetical protein